MEHWVGKKKQLGFDSLQVQKFISFLVAVINQALMTKYGVHRSLTDLSFQITPGKVPCLQASI